MVDTGARRRSRAGRRPGRGPRPRRPRPGPPLRRRRDDVVPRAGLAGARPPRRGRVRAPGDRGQAGAAGRERRRPPIRSPRCGPPSAPATSWSPSARPTTRSCSRAMRRAPAWGVDDASGSAPGARPPAGAADHVLWIDDVTGGGRARRAARAAVPRALGAHPRVLRAPGAARAGRRGVRAGRRPASPAPTRAGSAEVVAVPDATAARRCARPEASRPVDVTLVGAGRTRATSCSSTPASAIALVEEADGA